MVSRAGERLTYSRSDSVPILSTSWFAIYLLESLVYDVPGKRLSVPPAGNGVLQCPASLAIQRRIPIRRKGIKKVTGSAHGPLLGWREIGYSVALISLVLADLGGISTK
jgi:hypothetical protein